MKEYYNRTYQVSEYQANTYVNVLGHVSFGSCVLLLTLLFVVYYVILYLVSLYLYNRLEY